MVNFEKGILNGLKKKNGKVASADASRFSF